MGLDLVANIDEDTGDDVVSIVTEALSNALRHSGGSSIDVNVVADTTTCSIEVVDDGIGFDPGQPSSGMGLENLQARARRRGGAITIDTSESGTSLRVELPLS